MKTILIAAVTSCILLSSCGSDSPAEVYVPKDSTGKVITVNTNIPIQDHLKKNQPAATPQMAPQQVTTSANAAQMQQQDIQRQIQEQIAAQQAKMAATAATTTAKGMNPPHGQPGHRCDIPVGAPLNSKPAAQTTQVTTSPATQVVTAPGMNPPHGQPGHRCDIAVGAPLNSKPAINNTTTTTAVPLTADPAATTAPAKKDTGNH